MSPESWAFRVVCDVCRSAGSDCLSHDQFWARKPCEKCGGQQRVANCRGVKTRYRKLVWWNPLTWFAYSWAIEFKNGGAP